MTASSAPATALGRRARHRRWLPRGRPARSAPRPLPASRRPEGRTRHLRDRPARLAPPLPWATRTASRSAEHRRSVPASYPRSSRARRCARFPRACDSASASCTSGAIIRLQSIMRALLRQRVRRGTAGPRGRPRRPSGGRETAPRAGHRPHLVHMLLSPRWLQIWQRKMGQDIDHSRNSTTWRSRQDPLGRVIPGRTRRQTLPSPCPTARPNRPLANPMPRLRPAERLIFIPRSATSDPGLASRAAETTGGQARCASWSQSPS
jgi:hypothetical protein